MSPTWVCFNKLVTALGKGVFWRILRFNLKKLFKRRGSEQTDTRQKTSKRLSLLFPFRANWSRNFLKILFPDSRGSWRKSFLWPSIFRVSNYNKFINVLGVTKYLTVSIKWCNMQVYSNYYFFRMEPKLVQQFFGSRLG